MTKNRNITFGRNDRSVLLRVCVLKNGNTSSCAGSKGGAGSGFAFSNIVSSIDRAAKRIRFSNKILFWWKAWVFGVFSRGGDKRVIDDKISETRFSDSRSMFLAHSQTAILMFR